MIRPSASEPTTNPKPNRHTAPAHADVIILSDKNKAKIRISDDLRDGFLDTTDASSELFDLLELAGLLCFEAAVVLARDPVGEQVVSVVCRNDKLFSKDCLWGSGSL